MPLAAMPSHSRMLLASLWLPATKCTWSKWSNTQSTAASKSRSLLALSGWMGEGYPCSSARERSFSM